MQDKPNVIQARPGFSSAVIEAAERILAAETKDSYQRIAAQAKFEMLHRDACLGDEQADQKLVEFARQMRGDKDAKLAADADFFLLEHKVAGADDVPAEQIPDLLAEVKAYLADRDLTSRHLRIASSTVHAINRLEDPQQRELYFQEFGALFAKSDSKDLARYGKRLAKKPATAAPDLVGKPLELAGVTALGAEFQWDRYRDKVVLVDFWASWCGPCRQAMPQVKALHERLKQRGFEVVGVNLDKDPEALAKYLKDNPIPWENLVGEEAADLATKYGVRGIPTMILVDRKGTVTGLSNNLANLAPDIEKLLDEAGP
jgi:thiol-disulfide isomerase/thioredoxin